MLEALAQLREIDEGVALVVAHPDDETLAAGGIMPLFRRLLLIHVTDGAPRHLDDAFRAGFGNPTDYAATRARELNAALALSNAEPVRISLGVPDQEVLGQIAVLASELRALFGAHDIRHVLTHAYEGGHPDHDAIAVAVQLAGATEVFEFAGYHAAPGGGIETGRFLNRTPTAAPDQETAEIRTVLPPLELGRKRAMLACFNTQAAILAQFDPAAERFRTAPLYDFTRPPHPGRLLYEEWGWMSGESWRQRASEALCVA